jgi:hypothetical protein
MRGATSAVGDERFANVLSGIIGETYGLYVS